MASISGDDADNVLVGTENADSITGELGNDTITAGSGDDVIDSSSDTINGTPLFLDWTTLGTDGTDLSAGFVQNTGGIEVDVSFTNDGGGTTATVEENTTYTETGESFDPNSSLGLRGTGLGSTWTTTVDFSAATGSTYSDSVENVSFRIQDVDQNSWQDVVTVLAYDIDGNAVEVSLTAAGDDVVDGSTVTAGPTATGSADAAGSVLVNIPGPVAYFEIVYENLGTAGQLLYVTDVHFDAMPADNDVVYGKGGNDTVFGGYGEDYLDGGTGNDTVSGEEGNDTIYGGVGDDNLSGGDGGDTIYGGTGQPVSSEEGTTTNPWLYEYYDLDPTGDPRTLAQAGFTENGGLDHSGTPTATGTTTSITPTDYDTQDDYALKFTTQLTVTTGGTYTFETTSDDGSKLFVNGVEVVDNDGHHGAISRSGTITLGPGEHTIEIIYYENNGGNALSSTISGPDTGNVETDLATYSGLTQPDQNDINGADTIDGGAGDDYIDGEAGNDSLFGGTGSDTILGGTGADTIDGGDGADILNGGDDADYIIGGSGDVIDGGEGGDDNDTLFLGDAGATIDYDATDSEAGTVTFSDGSTATFTNIENVIPCFCPGSEVITINGVKRVEDLIVGDKVFTRDNGFQSIRWVGTKALTHEELVKHTNFKPIKLSKGSLGPNMPCRDMLVSPQHRMLVASSAVQLLLGEEEALIKAKHLTHKVGIDTDKSSKGVTYIHFMFDHHEIVNVDNTWTESFQPGEMLENDGTKDIFAELLSLFPELENADRRKAYSSARSTIKGHEAAFV